MAARTNVGLWTDPANNESSDDPVTNCRSKAVADFRPG